MVVMSEALGANLPYVALLQLARLPIIAMHALSLNGVRGKAGKAGREPIFQQSFPSAPKGHSK